MAKDRSGYIYQNKQGSWYARTTITDASGKRRNIKRRAKDKTDARETLKTLLRQLDDEGSRVVDFSQLTFNDLADFYEEKYLHEARYVNGQKISGLRDVARPKELLKHFRAFFGRKKLREITYGDLLTYRDARFKVQTQYKRQRTIASWNREAAVLRRIFSVGCQQGWLLKNMFHCGDPLIIVSAERRREKVLAVSEEVKLLEACGSHPYRTHLKSLLIFLLDTGCRKGEALKLRWRAVCFNSRIITLEATTTKTLKARQVMMTERLYVELITLYESSAKDSDERVFSITNNVRKSFASVCQVASIKHGGIDGLTLHSLRHTAATRLVQSGMNPQLAGRLLGHSQPQTTYRYLSADVETAAQAAAIMEALQKQVLKSQATAEPELVH
ncbi:MAG TPA: site-specific integrase [Pyrinomonadaceae bacterium]|nr:site-specific integrase [Pyrinomonadaceae bacterium]